MPVCFLTTTIYFNDNDLFLKTTETTGTTRRTGATAGCHEVTYNTDNGITSATEKVVIVVTVVVKREGG